ncbi:hypothetical protein MP638_004296 [Amoeboaphelidium occidentale]|nr:hypothetical protein MP638_004296 [Amoeboaphelidium occidentale]
MELNRLKTSDAQLICSQQVITDFKGCVKELLENSLDAGATEIEIKLRDYGLKGVEVKDNGKGIEQRNFKLLAQAHSTSKIEDYEDIESLRTYGFRGEALHSICQLSRMVVTTNDSSTSMLGYELEFDNSGNLLSQRQVSRSRGTTVSVTGLFQQVPVRWKDFQKNYKKEYVKVTKMVQEYCYVALGIRISLIDFNDKHGRQVVISSNGSVNLRDNLVHLHGPNFVDDLCLVDLEFKIKMKENTTKKLTKFEAFRNTSDQIASSKAAEAKEDDGNVTCKVYGYLSKPSNMNNKSTDKSHLFINKRPCDIPKIIRKIYELYRKKFVLHTNTSFNPASKSIPVVILLLELPDGYFDVNVTPDKRKIFLQQESKLIDELLLQLENELEDYKGELKLDLSSSQSTSSYRERTILDFSSFRRLSNVSTSSAAAAAALKTSDNGITTGFQQKSTPTASSLKRLSFDPSFSLSSSSSSAIKTEHNPTIASTPINSITVAAVATATEDIKHSLKKFNNFSGFETPTNDTTAMKRKQQQQQQQQEVIEILDNEKDEDEIIFKKPRPVSSQIVSELDHNTIDDYLPSSSENTVDHEKDNCCSDDHHKKEDLCLDEDSIKKRLLNKNEFTKMTIVGQFNLGFILATLPCTEEENGLDLFIIDQHAADEKHLYERYKQELSESLEKQQLIQPLTLQKLSPSQQFLLKQNLDYIRKRFSLNIIFSENEDKFFILSKPVLYKKQCNEYELIVDLLTQLEHHQHEHEHEHSTKRKDEILPNQWQYQLASRACRKATMIGDVLDRRQMKKIVDNLSKLEQPWNCPHGRPTVRWLSRISLSE